MLQGQIPVQTQKTEGDGAAIVPLHACRRSAPDVDRLEPHYRCSPLRRCPTPHAWRMQTHTPVQLLLQVVCLGRRVRRDVDGVAGQLINLYRVLHFGAAVEVLRRAQQVHGVFLEVAGKRAAGLAQPEDVAAAIPPGSLARLFHGVRTAGTLRQQSLGKLQLVAMQHAAR